jgi:sulfur dioxygenase
MRRGCQWTLVLLLLSGCSGAPGGSSSPAAGGAGTPATPAAPAMLESMQPAAARAFLAAHPDALVLDVRDPEEWDDDLGHIEGARQIPLPQLSARMAEIAAWKYRPVVVLCRVGVRSQQAAELLIASGYQQVIHLEGGMEAWRKSEGSAAGR